MKQDGHRRDRLVPAALLRVLALVLVALGPPGTLRAQESLPSVSDYRLPSGTSSPRVRPQGPVDADNPAVVSPRSPPSAGDDSAAAAPAATPSPKASAAAAPTTAPATTPRPSQAARATASPSASSATPSATASATAPDAPASSAAAVPIEWNVHSAQEVIALQSPGIWPLLAGIAFLIGVGITLLLQNGLRRRRERVVQADGPTIANDAPLHTASSRTTAIRPVETAPGHAGSPPPVPEPVLDLLTVMASPEPLPAEPSSQAAQQTAASRPALDLHVNPLDVVLAARRMSATLMNVVLNYELIVSNQGREPIGPVTVGGDMIGAHASLPDRAQLELSGQAIIPLHRLASLAPGESITLSGEFKLPLAAITPIRSGNAALFIPLARFRVEAARAGAPPLVANSAFVIGEDQDRPGAALKPFRLDLGPRLYSRIGQRELALSA